MKYIQLGTIVIKIGYDEIGALYLHYLKMSDSW